MKLLAIDTATEACSAALLLDDTVLERFEITSRGHSQLILPMIDDLLAEAGIAVSGLDALAFGRGPGAFTGVRIAVGVVQGIAFGADLPVIPVSTLAALALGADRDKVLTAIDARMGEIYWAAYTRSDDGLMAAVLPECVTSPSQAPLPEGDHWFGAGSGFRSYTQELMTRLGERLVGQHEAALPHAADVARLGRAEFLRGNTVTAEQALPVYLRDEVAWRKTGNPAG